MQIDFQILLIYLHFLKRGIIEVAIKLHIYKPIIFLLCLLASLTGCGEPPHTARILMIHSFEADYPAYPDFNRMLRTYLNKEGIQADLRVAYLDCEQYRAWDEEKRMRQCLDTIAAWQPDLILVSEDQATYSLLATHHPLAGKVPIVFSGVNFPNYKLLEKYPNATGFHDKPDYLANLRLIEQLMGTCGLFMLHDSTYLDLQAKKEIHLQLDKAGIRVEDKKILYAPMTEEELKNTQPYIDRPDSTTVNIVPVQGDKLAVVSFYMSRYAPYKYYLQSKRDYRVMNISRFAGKPSFTTTNDELGYGSKLVGGYITSLETQVREMAVRAAEILKGVPVGSFPQLTESEKAYVFDFGELEFWNIDKAKLPPGSVFLHRPFSKRFPVLFWGMVLLGIGMLILVFFFLIIKTVQTSRAEKLAKRALLHEKESLAVALKKAEESDRMKSVFLANMSHEIRTPLNAIVGFSQLISDKEVPTDEKEEYANIILTNVDLLLKLVNDILDLARIESGHLVFQHRSCNLNDLINDVYVHFLADIPEGVQFVKHIPEKQVCIFSDYGRISQILDNFMRNAVKFTISGTIEIGYQYDADTYRVRLYVKDTGPGIPKEKQTAIFERFSKLNEFVQGTGLGLSICQAIAERLDGKLTLESELGKGSCFSVQFSSEPY